MSDEICNIYEIRNWPDLTNLKYKLKVKRIFGPDGDGRWSTFLSEFLERQHRKNRAEGILCPLTDNEFNALSDLGCLIKEHVYVCNCGYCNECNEREIEEKRTVLNDEDKAKIYHLETKFHEMELEVLALSTEAKEVWELMHPVSSGPVAMA